MSIQSAAFHGVMPCHKGAGKQSDVIIKNDDPRMIHLQNHFNYLNKLSLTRSEPQNRLQQWLMERVAVPIERTRTGILIYQ